MDAARTKTALIEALRERMAAAGQRAAGATFSSGFPPLDALLADGGFRAGTLVEWLVGDAGLGTTTLALAAAREACYTGGALVVFDGGRQFYPPAAVRRGLDPQQLILVYAGTRAEETWALDQALRSAAVGAVLAWPERLDDKTFRRLQLAAEEGGGLGLLVRPEKACKEPSWADVRLLVTPASSVSRRVGRAVRNPRGDLRSAWVSSTNAAHRCPSTHPTHFTRRVRIVLLRSRGGTDGRTIEIEVDDDSHPLRVAPPLADPTPRRRRA